MRVSLECQLLVLCQSCLHSCFSVMNGHIFIVNRSQRLSVAYQEGWKLMICTVLQSWAVKVEIQTYVMFLLVVRAPIYMCLHFLTGNSVLVPFLTWTCGYKVDSHFSLYIAPLFPIHNLEGSKFISEQDTRNNPRVKFTSGLLPKFHFLQWEWFKTPFDFCGVLLH